MEKLPAVYILASRKNGTLYTGVSSNLVQRVYQHKHHMVEGFSQRYKVDILVWYETTPNIASAIAREKQIKGWVRRKKIALLEQSNPEWRDLYEEIL